MPIISTSLKEIHAVRNTLKAEEIKLGKVQQNVNVTKIERVKGAALPLVLVEYVYETVYELAKPTGQSLGKIKIVGELVYQGSEEEVEKIVSDWKAKKIDKKYLTIFANAALTDANIEALQLAKKTRLPLPVALPKLRLNVKKEAA